MNTMLEDSDMDALSNEDAAKVGILHTLKQIRNRPEVGWYLGVGTQVFSLLTKALSKMTGTDVAELRTTWACPNAKNPAEREDDDKIAADALKATEEKGMLLEIMQDTDVIDFIDELSESSRMDLLQQLRERYCADCGAVHVVRFGECDCHARRLHLAESIRLQGGVR